MRTTATPPIRVDGHVAAGFEPVARCFADRAFEVGQGGAAFAATVDGELVVDLWAGYAGEHPWRRETRAVLMSVTKQLATLALGRLIERGQLDVEAPVAHYWPEFAAAGKAAVTVAELLAHMAGLVVVPGYESFLGPDGTGWDQRDEIVDRLARSRPAWSAGSASGYHALTMGWLVDELAERAGGRSVGSILRDEIARPFQLDLDLGTPRSSQRLVAPIIGPGARPNPPGRLGDGLQDPGSLLSRSLFAVDGRTLHDSVDVLLNDQDRLAMELPFGNATGTARSLAVLNGALAAGGRLGNGSVLRPATIELLTRERFHGTDCLTGLPARWGLGIRRNLPATRGATSSWGPHESAFGFDGLGGQISFTDPGAGVGAGFVRSNFTWTSELGRRLVDSLYSCVRERCAACRRGVGGLH
ncbi:beta-lactamase family protein [Dactylosporangium roseum]|uniref:Beta-lactamase family protein n=1 Tax=Dactylosporangium roseum TaxID=47989 RepID=A0ABY5YZP0_9ACTN|nr:serine hydrolase domain-containing protein [Dactylosporangium roseum]UWZ34831.1 beta-lactamase family protein [Dactylosporangium roseum]